MPNIFYKIRKIRRILYRTPFINYFKDESVNTVGNILLYYV